ncbi:MAG: aminobenzoyl-glutamate transporter [Deltaproteobacteria bacterium]|nr:MAG: aminobenzoyl-glutamate transporter [Deltaproteobacteria bacterium]
MEAVKRKGMMDRLLNFVEVTGNKMPDPVTIFIVLTAVFMLISCLLSYLGVTIEHPMTKKEVSVINMLSVSSLQNLLAGMVKNFQAFPPLGLVLVVMFGAGVADKTGFMAALLKKSIAKTPKQFITLSIVFIGIVANAAGDAGFIVLPPLAGVIYASVGRHPLAGIFVAFAAVAAGFSANIMVNMLDILIASFTIPAAQVIKPEYVQTPAMNYYFLVVSTVVLVIAAVFITEKVIEPRLGEYKGAYKPEEKPIDDQAESLGLKYAGISFAVLTVLLIALCLGERPFLGDPKTGSLLSYNAYLMKGMVPIVAVFFLIPAVFYGIGVGRIKNDKDVIAMMNQAMNELGGYIVLIFFAAQFLAVFTQSNMGIVLATSGANFLKNIGFSGLPLIFCFLVFSSFINMFVGSASAKWAILAPVFVPMFLLLGYDPAFTQMAYRIGDSITNPVSPIFPYFPILIAFAKKYDKDIGMGKIIANMLPYSMVFGILWFALLAIFMIFDLPLGPGAGIYI